jgi:hypothetical protein
MGSIQAEWELFPVPYVDVVLMEKIETRIVKPTIDGLRKMGYRTKVLCLLD